MRRDDELDLPRWLLRIFGGELYNNSVQLLDEHLLHLGMQMGLRFFDKDEMRDRARNPGPVELVIALQLQEHVDQVAGAKPVVAFGEVHSIRPGIDHFRMIRQQGVDIQRRLRPQLGIVQAGKS